jgi:hypothetical protein
MNIYEQIEEEVKIINQQEILDRKIYVEQLKSKEKRMLEAFDDMGLEYEKDGGYLLEEMINGRIKLEYQVKLHPQKFTRTKYGEKEDFYFTRNVRASKDGYYISDANGFIGASEEGKEFDVFIERLKNAIRQIIKNKIVKQ